MIKGFMHIYAQTQMSQHSSRRCYFINWSSHSSPHSLNTFQCVLSASVVECVQTPPIQNISNQRVGVGRPRAKQTNLAAELLRTPVDQHQPTTAIQWHSYPTVNHFGCLLFILVCMTCFVSLICCMPMKWRPEEVSDTASWK